ncbi:hypothetical protein [Pedobacter endophyticus]|uniref:Uncharacterized protein n=1 Tax=Pedobacter endophyticus TaxID=2789740 RepID=A0A7S9L0E6_9SPHI|nr:hypothetical protein [Pedobacter endophyticus]QPH40186.1 hypothetical protein IZT61_02580 [Pedobacter endophyticus]
MKITGTHIRTLNTGDKVLILLAENKEEQKKLHHYLLIDAYQFKQDVAEDIPKVDFISAGYKDEDDKIIYDRNLIEIPKWFEKN